MNGNAKSRPLRARLWWRLLVAVAVSGALQAPALAAPALRAEVGKPLQAAAELYKQRKYAEAMKKVREAEAAAKPGDERLAVDRMRAAVAAAGGDNATAAKAYEDILASGKTTGPERLKMMQAVASLHYQAGSSEKAAEWIERYLAEGGTDAQMRGLLVQARYQAKDCAGVAKLVEARASESDLQLLGNCYVQLGRTDAYVGVLEQLVARYPKPDYWSELLARQTAKKGFSNRLALDLLRLRVATGTLRGAADYMEAAQLALQEGFPHQAKAWVDQGFTSGVLGKGPSAERHQRLRTLAETRAQAERDALARDEAASLAAKNAEQLVRTGFRYVTAGEHAKGVGLMEQGVRAGGLKHVEEAKLHLGIAYRLAGMKAKANQMLATVRGSDGAADLARLWARLP